jgi:hypothetical protein
MRLILIVPLLAGCGPDPNQRTTSELTRPAQMLTTTTESCVFQTAVDADGVMWSALACNAELPRLARRRDTTAAERDAVRASFAKLPRPPAAPCAETVTRRHTFTLLDATELRWTPCPALDTSTGILPEPFETARKAMAALE